MARPKGVVTEYDAATYIENGLRALGWDMRHPERHASGQVYTQNEALANPELAKWWGTERPEATVKVTDADLWVIEAKPLRAESAKAISEAQDYAEKVNRSSRTLKVRFVSGVAGNEMDTFDVLTRYRERGGWVDVTFDGQRPSALLTPDQASEFLRQNSATIENPPIDERLFVAGANNINRILHLASVNPHLRARVMAALLLSMLGDTIPAIATKNATQLIADINSRAEAVLEEHGKQEFLEYVRIPLPPRKANHVKFRKALVDSIQELNDLNIRSAMNSGNDVLGLFYEVFLKYASWAQDLGIVLTPRHLTRYVARVVGPRANDLVFDPTCGTGGFLVAAFDHVKREADPSQLTKFKQRLFGVEQDPGVAALAVVNMIFRGDGKNNIREGDCFTHFIKRDLRTLGGACFADEQQPDSHGTLVMMNPPFALKKSDEKEFRFIDHALAQMETGGLLFSVLPYSALTRPSIYLVWRRDQLLRNHRLLSVVSLPPDIFYPIGVVTLGIFVKKGEPHRPEDPVLWVRAQSDGLLKSKGRRLPNPKASNDLEVEFDTLKAFLRNPTMVVPSVPRHHKVCPIDMDDRLLELVPEKYLDDTDPTEDEIRQGIDQTVRDLAAHLLRTRHEDDVAA